MFYTCVFYKFLKTGTRETDDDDETDINLLGAPNILKYSFNLLIETLELVLETGFKETNFVYASIITRICELPFELLTNGPT